ncbi:MAG: transcriptional regulator [Acidobacteriota bacterium]|nr:transcriptional regulator [Acidobacteriota bacterium]
MNPSGVISEAKSEARMDPRLHTELWTSWASLLRSYAGAHGLNSRHHAVVEVGADEITLRVAGRSLRFTHVQMEDSFGNRSLFALQEDGTVKLNGTTEEMDLAAERLAREMMQSE